MPVYVIAVYHLFHRLTPSSLHGQEISWQSLSYLERVDHSVVEHSIQMQSDIV